MLKYKAYHHIAKIQKIEVFRESKYYIWLKSGLKIKKSLSHASYHDSFDAAKYALIGKCGLSIMTHEASIDHYKDILYWADFLTEEDVN